MSTALGVDNIVNSNGSVTGTDALQLRHILKARWDNPGKITGLTVTGRSDLKYNVAAGVAVCSRGTSDGYTEAYYAGGTTSAVSAGDASNPRIDLVYILPHDSTQGDSDNQVVVDVVQGTPAASPTTPSTPSGAVALAAMRVASGATNTSAATNILDLNYAIPYGSSLGIISDKTFTTNQYKTGNDIMTRDTIYLPTDRAIEFHITVTASANGGKWTNGEGSVYVHPIVDNAVIRTFEVRLFPAPFAGSSFSTDVVSLTAGSHTVGFNLEQTSSTADSVQLYYSASGWAGQRFLVTDMGAIK